MKPQSYNLRFLCLMLLMMVGARGLHATDYLCFTATKAGSVKLSKNGSVIANIQ